MTLGQFCRFLAWAWLISVALLAVAFRWIGEHWPATAALLFVPVSVWVMPGGVLALTALIHRDWRMMGTLCTGCLVATFWLCGWRWHAEKATPTASSDLQVTVLTHNTGQRGNTSLQPFKNSVQPDFLILQDAPSRARRYLAATGYEEFPHAEDIGEFTLVSRYPIVSKELVQRPATDVPRMMSYPLAARFEVSIRSQRIVIYNVHAFSPREYLGFAGVLRSVFYSLAGWPGTRWVEGRQRLEAFWDAQIAATELLTQRFAAETLPVIVAGDFNAPSHGAIHRLLTASLHDSHREAGHGCGYTFPGTTRNPLSAFGPWLRLDYVLASRHWRILSNAVEPHNPSQHRALAATLVLHSAP